MDREYAELSARALPAGVGHGAWVYTFVQVLGATLVVAGVVMWSVVAGVITAGVLLIAFGVALEQGEL